MKRHVYRPGDSVVIVNPQFIERIGYPTTWGSRLPEFRQHPKLLEAMALLGIPGTHAKSKAALDFAIGAAKAANRMAGFGGPTRSIHYYENVSGFTMRDATATIIRKRVVYTGTYYPSSGGKYWTDCGWEYEYSPGGLDGRVAHIVLDTTVGLIEAVNVRPADT